MPKANKPNAFFNFMIKWKQTQEKSGRKFPGGLKDVQSDPECNAAWQRLSAGEKSYYKNMVMPNMSQKIIPKKTGSGEVAEHVEKQKLEKEQFSDRMVEEITALINNAKQKNCIPKLQFYVIHINYFYSYKSDDSSDIKFHAAEIAVVEFSLEKGITRQYNQIINEQIRMGYRGTAVEKSSGSHQIPINAPMGKSNACDLFKDICDFIKPGAKDGKLPPLYTLHFNDDIYEPVKSVLSNLAIANGEVDDYFVIYSFEQLFTTIHNSILDFSENRQIEPIVATIAIKKDPYAFKKGLACEYHSSLEAGQEFCSQSFAKRWIFVLCHHCCDPLDIDKVPGNHRPIENFDSDDGWRSMNSTFSSFHIEPKKIISSISMTGVSSEHRESVSQRSYQDEIRRRNESKPLQIVDFSKSSAKTYDPVQRPLRAPFTKSAVTNIVDTTDTESIDLSESSFPSIGRGGPLKNKDDSKKAVGGYAGCLKKLK